jgi:hypothetical protein
MRGSFSGLFHDYQTTFPDRYFTGLNILFLVFIFTLFDNSFKKIYVKYLLCTLVILFLLVSIIRMPIFEFSNPLMADRSIGTFKDSICRSVSGDPILIGKEVKNVVEIPIYPVWNGYPWRLAISTSSLENTINTSVF